METENPEYMIKYKQMYRSLQKIAQMGFEVTDHEDKVVISKSLPSKETAEGDKQ